MTAPPTRHWLTIPEHDRGARPWRVRAWYEYCPETGQVRHRLHPTGAALRERRGEVAHRAIRGGCVLLVADVPGRLVRVNAPLAGLALLALLEARWVVPPPGAAQRVTLRDGARRATLDALAWRHLGLGLVPLELTALGRSEWRGPEPDSGDLPEQVRSLLRGAGRPVPDEVDQDQPHSVLTARQVPRWLPPEALPNRNLLELRAEIEPNARTLHVYDSEDE